MAASFTVDSKLVIEVALAVILSALLVTLFCRPVIAVDTAPLPVKPCKAFCKDVIALELADSACAPGDKATQAEPLHLYNLLSSFVSNQISPVPMPEVGASS